MQRQRNKSKTVWRFQIYLKDVLMTAANSRGITKSNLHCAHPKQHGRNIDVLCF